MVPISTNDVGPGMHQVLNRLSGGESELYKALCEVAFTTALGPQTLRRLDALKARPAPTAIKALMGITPTESVNRLRELCDKSTPITQEKRVTVRKHKEP